MVDVQTERSYYAELGFDTLPLLPNSKKAYSVNWENRDPEDLWRDSPVGCNIGIRAGGKVRVAMIDCDEKKTQGTFGNVSRFLIGLGYSETSLPVIQTASGTGRQIYVEFKDSLPGSIGNLRKEMGSGEFRYGQGAYVVAPPSLVNDTQYKLINGRLCQLPLLRIADVGKLIDLSVKENIQPVQIPTTRFNYTSSLMPRRTLELLKGNGVNTDRSITEQSILTGLANKNFPFEKVLNLFIKYPAAGKFMEMYLENRGRAIAWLQASYNKALAFTVTHESETRIKLLRTISWAENSLWTGKAKTIDQVVFIAHAKIAHRAGKMEYAASVRDLALDSGCTTTTVSNANKRLIEKGLIDLIVKSVADKANVYLIKSQTYPLPIPPHCEEVYKNETEEREKINE